MVDLDFRAFSSRTFEQFSQALATRVLGPGIAVFGDGPDAGREASFIGKLPYPSTEDPWDGKLYLQAKFRQHPQRDGRDAQWLVDQLRKEAVRFKSFIRPAPDYYILVTNIRLSGVESIGAKGGQRKLEEAFATLLAPIGFKEMHVWHEEKIASLLDAYPDLLRSYGGWLGTKEVLAEIFAEFEGKIPRFNDVMLRFLQRELREHRNTRLQQAGHIDDAPMGLERVFVDLPYTSGSRASYRPDQTIEEPGRPGLVAALLLRIEEKLADQEENGASRQISSHLRSLVLGGPGQGKSTIVQFLSQILRLRLLRLESPDRLSRDIPPILDAIEERASELGLSIDGVRRYPFRIDLPAFADALTAASASGTRLSLLDFLAERIASVANEARIDSKLMRDWLASYPWLLLLDGLDEVPPSANRQDLLRAFSEFWDEAIPINADVAVVITSRPQGYNNELRGEGYTEFEMTRLRVSDALAYAERLAILKLPEQERRDRVLQRLLDASANETTANLMISPLQVAILFQIVDQRGRAPTDRWSLFDEYLSVVIKREQEKHPAAGNVVQEREIMIRRLVRRAALLLHVEGEKNGRTQSFLTRQRLKNIATDLLSEEGYEHREIEEIAERIVEATTDRLVFLEQRVEGRIEFDVRSLQEFMAAAELMSASDDHVTERLRAIAGRTHWQHVYRIAASKAFASPDAAKYRDAVITANRGLDEETPSAKLVRRGATVALDLLWDGLAHDQPRYRRLLASHALDLLALGPKSADPRLSSIIAQMGSDFARAALPPLVSAGDPEVRRATWHMLLATVPEEDHWLERLVDDLWPESEAAQLELIGLGVLPRVGTRADRLLREALANSAPSVVRAHLEFERNVAANNKADLSARYPFLDPILRTSSNTEPAALFLDGRHELRLVFVTPKVLRESKIYRPDLPGAWGSLGPIRAFVDDPTCENAAQFVEAARKSTTLEEFKAVRLPWLLKSLLALLDHGVSPDLLAEAVRAGDYGTPTTWQLAQDRLRSKGVTAADLATYRKGTLIDHEIATVGFPCYEDIILGKKEDTNATWLPELIRAFEATPSGACRAQLRELIGVALPAFPSTGLLDAKSFIALYGPQSSPTQPLDPVVLESLKPEFLGAPVILAHLDQRGRTDGYSSPKQRVVLRSFVDDPLRFKDSEGLWTLAVASRASSASDLFRFAQSIDEGVIPEAAEEPGVAEAVAVIQLGQGLIDPGEAGRILAKRRLAGIAQIAAFQLADSLPTDRMEQMMAAFITSFPSEATNIRARAIDFVCRQLDKQTSRLRDPDEWQGLGLPATLHTRLVHVEA